MSKYVAVEIDSIGQNTLDILNKVKETVQSLGDEISSEELTISLNLDIENSEVLENNNRKLILNVKVNNDQDELTQNEIDMLEDINLKEKIFEAIKAEFPNSHFCHTSIGEGLRIPQLKATLVFDDISFQV